MRSGRHGAKVVRQQGKDSTMTKDDLHRLAATLEKDGVIGGEDTDRLAGAIDRAFSDRPKPGNVDADAFGSTDALLALVADALPTWSLHLGGSSATVHGRWTCTIRETGVRDDDELIGVGKSPTAAGAVMAALLKVIALRGGAD
jgi:hypothetical protein